MRAQFAHRAVALVLLTGCSSRSCATCVGYSPDRSTTELNDLRFEVEQIEERTTVSFGLGLGDSELCPSLTDGATVAWNGVAAKPERNGGGKNMWWGRGDAYTLCVPIVTKIPLLKATTTATTTDQIEIKDEKGSFKAAITTGRPALKQLSDGTAEIVLEGFEGEVKELSPCGSRAAFECEPLKVLSNKGNRIVVKLDDKARVVKGKVKLAPTTKCTGSPDGGKPRSCTSTVTVSLNLPY